MLLEDLRVAYEKQDWNLIKDIYKNVSGQDLQTKPNLVVEYETAKMPKKKPTRKATKTTTKKTPTKATKVPKAIKVKAAKVNKQQIKEEKGECLHQINNNNAVIGRKYARAEPLGKFKQTFVDNPKEYQEESVKNNPSLGTTPLNVLKKDRQKPSLAKVQCSECDKWEEVNPILATSYSKQRSENTYRCNDCCGHKRG
jgi:hypothetical protein